MDNIPYIYLIISFIIGNVNGLLIFSRGSLFMTLPGLAAQSILSTVCIILIAYAFWQYGWVIGLLELFIVLIGGNIGRGTLNILRRM